MKILAFAATNHKESINKKLLRYTLNRLQEEGVFDVELIDLIDYELPLYRQDREHQDGIPKMARIFYEKIGAADVLVASFAEHNSSYTAVYKNLFDWTSRIDQKVYQGKPTMIMSTSPGARGGAGVLGTVEQGAPFFGMEVFASVSVPKFYETFDAKTGAILNSGIKEEVQKAIASLLKKEGPA